MLRRPEVLPVLGVHAHLHGGLSGAGARVPQRLRASARRVRPAHAEVRVPVARAHGLREAAAARRPRPPLHGEKRQRTGTGNAQTAPQKTTQKL